MNNKSHDYLIPWTQHGVPWKCSKNANVVSYFDYTNRKYLNGLTVTWKKNTPFKAAFEIKRFTGSTDATQIIVQHTETEQLFYIRDSDFLEALKKSACTFGVLLGEWKIKRTVGKYYGLIYVG